MKADVVTYRWVKQHTCMSEKDLAAFKDLFGDRAKVTLTNLLKWVHAGHNGIFLAMIVIRFFDHITRQQWGDEIRAMFGEKSNHLIELRERRFFLESMEARVLLFWSYYAQARRWRRRGIRP